ncbi:MAG: tetraacyldisaccharide 4'-kinase [Tannerella sp.]|jgi:tetraacyldisaccharide 4'-kinase|nr:tetraacyldisaccharide 4'-kinase [Tannerella sp.]
MAEKQGRFHYLLYPFATFYGLGVWIRNMLFDGDILASTAFPVPVICVGNLEAGGTGKTPMVEYLIRLLMDKYRIAVLSRGYMRESSGYVIADKDSTPQLIGDEAYQIKCRYPDVTVAVDKNRVRGIHNLLDMPEDVRPQVIVLDDAFQHRHVQPSFSILITDYSRLYYKDKLLPVGRLRESAGSVRRANIVVVSKCDESLKPIDCRIIENEMKLLAYQKLFFSTITYQPLDSVFPDKCAPRPLDSICRDDEILLLTGIANPRPLIDKMKQSSDRVTVISYPDHHGFTKKDIRRIHAELSRMKSDNSLIVCTEKDAARLRSNPHVPDEWKTRLYSIPIKMTFAFDKGRQFDEQVLHQIHLVEKSSILRQ